MKSIRKFTIFSGLFIITLYTFSYLHAPNTDALTDHRDITHLALFLKFSNSDSIVRKTDDGTPIHLDDDTSVANAEKILNSETLFDMDTAQGIIQVPSLKKYYETQSYGRLSINSTIFPKTNGKIISYQDPNPIEYYLRYSDSNPDGYKDNAELLTRETELVNHIISAIRDQVKTYGLTSDQLDTNHDGIVDAISIFVEGADNSSGKYPVASNDLLWSHKRDNLNITDDILGKKVSAYNIIYGADYTQSAGIFSLNRSNYGTILHEFGHTLGLMDLYRYNRTSTEHRPVGFYDLMGDVVGSNPQNLLTYFVTDYHASMNWHNPLPVIQNTTKSVTLSKPQFINPDEKRAIKIQPNPNSKEYFIVEYHSKQNTYASHSADSDGIIIYRVNDNYKYYGNNGDNDHIFIFRPGETNLGDANGNLSQATLNLSRPTLGKKISANADFDPDTIYYANGNNSGIIVTVTAETDTSITFDVNFPDVVGNGTSNQPYQIDSVTTFLYLMQTNTTGKYYILTNDLDFTNIAYPEINFTGHLDGQNHTLSNITAKGTGVFNDLGDYNHSSSVQNLQVQNLVISPTTGNTLGGLASVASNVTITNVHLKSGSITNTKHAFNDLAATGGFIGNADDKTVIDRCSSSLTVNATKNVGGFIGLNQNATISNSQALGKVTGQQNTGSFIGTQYTNTNPKLPQNSQYNASINPTLPTVGTIYNPDTFQYQTPPTNLLQSITPLNPTSSITEAELLNKLQLTKKGNFLTGFTLGQNINSLRQTFTNIKGVNIVYLRNANGQELHSGVISTGLNLALKIDNTTYTYIIVIKGDVNGDGAVQATDYVRIRNHIMGKSLLTGASLHAADANNDGNVQATDYVKVRNHIMGKTTIDQK